MKLASITIIDQYHWSVFPCDSRKHPLTANGFKDASNDAGIVTEWWAKYPAALIGVPTGRDSEIAVLDIDNKNGKNGSAQLQSLIDRHGPLPETPKCSTVSGGEHYYFKYPAGVYKVKSTTDKIAPGIDTRGDGGYIIVPPSAGYDWEITPEECDYAELPRWLYPYCVQVTKPEPAKVQSSQYDDSEVSEALGFISPDNYDDWLHIGMALHSVGAFELWETWSKQSDKYSNGACSSKWGTFKTGGGVGIGTLFALAKRGGWTKPEPAETAEKKPKLGKAAVCNNWVKHNMTLSYNEFSERARIFIGETWRDLTDEHLTHYAIKAAYDGLSFGKDMFFDTVTYHARLKGFHPVKDYLDSLQWDGIERIDDLLSDYFGADDIPINNAYSRKFMIGAVARIMQPGCKMDNMLVLQGNQGIGKSRAVATLASEDWCDVGLPPLKNGPAAAQQKLAGVWIFEIAELDGLRGVEATAVKSFLSTSEDRFRPPYGRNQVTRKRQTLFVGTTNETDYLTDSTGSRRFWCVDVGQVDITGLSLDRSQLWAEAVHRYRKGEQWFLTPEEESMREANNMSRTEVDPWADKVDEFIRRTGNLDVYRQRDLVVCIYSDGDEFDSGIIPSKARKADVKRISAIMHQAGYSGPKNIRVGEQVTKGYNRAKK